MTIKKIHDWIDKENNVITLVFFWLSFFGGWAISWFTNDWRENTIETGINTYGFALMIAGTTFFFINLFIKRFKTRIIWFIIAFYPQLILIHLYGSSWALFGETPHTYKYTPHAMIAFFITEILYLLIVRKNDTSKGEEL